MEQGRNAEAVPHLEEAMRLQPRYYQGHYNLGKALAAEGKNMPAIESFSAALRLKPDYADAYYARAVMWHKSGNALAAEKDYRAALQADLAMPYEAEACNGLGVLLAQRGDLAAAITQFEAAVKLRPGFTEAQRNLTLARTQQGQTAPGSRAPR
jgi:Tfp pilus assembly protein PilF